MTRSSLRKLLLLFAFLFTIVAMARLSQDMAGTSGFADFMETPLSVVVLFILYLLGWASSLGLLPRSRHA
ncbi:MAG: hypothetical protein AAGB22_05945 [Bacteroidota bacterium]